MDKFWMIVDVSKRDEGFTYGPYDFILRPMARPRYCHSDKDSAESELLRLQQIYHECRFVLLEAVAECRESDVTVKQGQDLMRPYLYIDPITD